MLTDFLYMIQTLSSSATGMMIWLIGYVSVLEASDLLDRPDLLVHKDLLDLPDRLVRKDLPDRLDLLVLMVLLDRKDHKDQLDLLRE